IHYSTERWWLGRCKYTGWRLLARRGGGRTFFELASLVCRHRRTLQVVWMTRMWWVGVGIAATPRPILLARLIARMAALLATPTVTMPARIGIPHPPPPTTDRHRQPEQPPQLTLRGDQQYKVDTDANYRANHPYRSRQWSHLSGNTHLLPLVR